MVDFASEVGVTRQAIDQALSASPVRPLPFSFVGGMYLFHRSELREWWDARKQVKWQERRRRFAERGVQLNVRIGAAALLKLDGLREEGETRTAVARRVMYKALMGEELEFTFAKGGGRRAE